MSLPRFYPWQHDLARQWLADRERFAHAWLLHGLTGIGKVTFAHAAAASLLCERPVAGLACGDCPSCTWMTSGNHPDFRRIRPEAVAVEEGADAPSDADEGDGGGESAAPASGSAKRAPSKDIRIDQIRALGPWFNMATHRGGWRVALLYPAEALNVMAANALLKILEEPPEHTILLIVADAPDRLLPTLLSRCRRLPMATPDATQALLWLGEQGVAAPDAWLAAAGGAPLAALTLSQTRESACPEWAAALLQALARGQPPDVGAMADSIEKTPASEWIDTLQRLYIDLSLAQVGAPVRYFPALAQASAAAAARAKPEPLAEGARWLTRQRTLATHPLNAKLFIHAALQRVVLSCQA
ncbi:DNA polymerase III subunit delta' [Alcaligenaceae bacterium C4P045]|nr:DNA polymerase III subunit delta' [Alcaligenaceae bacterium C4P045]